MNRVNNGGGDLRAIARSSRCSVEGFAGRIVERARLDAVSEETFLARAVTSAACTECAIVEFLRPFVEVFHNNGVSCRFIVAAGA